MSRESKASYIACPVYYKCLHPWLCEKGKPCPPKKDDKEKAK